MDDKEWVMSKRKKTNIAFNVLLLDLPKAIISKYNHDTYRDGKLFPILSKPRLACLNFFNALECIPKVIESHDKEIAKVSANKEVYTAIANSSWKKEEDLRSLKAQAAELDRKIALTLSPPEEEKENLEKEVQESRDYQEAIQSPKDSLDNLKPSRSNSPKSMKHF